MNRVLVLVAFLACAFAVNTASAQPPEYQVAYDVGDLNDPRKAAALYAKIKKEAINYCADRIRGVRGLFARDVNSECVEAVVADLVEQVNHPALYALYEDEGALMSKHARRAPSGRHVR